jgi:hypothetical protein
MKKLLMSTLLLGSQGLFAQNKISATSIFNINTKFIQK